MLIVNVLTLPNASTKSGAKISNYSHCHNILDINILLSCGGFFHACHFNLPLQHGIRLNLPQTADSGHESNAEISIYRN